MNLDIGMIIGAIKIIIIIKAIIETFSIHNGLIKYISKD
jgi:hypothetical protein